MHKSTHELAHDDGAALPPPPAIGECHSKTSYFHSCYEPRRVNGANRASSTLRYRERSCFYKVKLDLDDSKPTSTIISVTRHLGLASTEAEQGHTLQYTLAPLNCALSNNKGRR